MKTLLETWNFKNMKNEELSEQEKADFLGRRLCADTPEKVKGEIERFLSYEDLDEGVKEFLGWILENETLLAKTQVISDGSYSNRRVFVRRWMFACQPDLNGERDFDFIRKSPAEKLQWFEENVDFFHLQFSHQTKEEWEKEKWKTEIW